ncbi:MAG TPA: hypothetical protein VEW08_02105 [Steroidobacteraceae bacterium]|nr:hypothetical protein [Steroidobacteraceae bacterium]
MSRHVPWIALLAALGAGAYGCSSLTAESPLVKDKLKAVSAGYTGCMPEENELSNVAPKPDGSGTWNATCKGKSFLCSAVADANNSVSFHCAPVAE